MGDGHVNKYCTVNIINTSTSDVIPNLISYTGPPELGDATATPSVQCVEEIWEGQRSTQRYNFIYLRCDQHCRCRYCNVLRDSKYVRKIERHFIVCVKN